MHRSTDGEWQWRGLFNPLKRIVTREQRKFLKGVDRDIISYYGTDIPRREEVWIILDNVMNEL